MSIRAFLSHSSTDKGVVQRVADQLGRAAVIYDKFEFSSGDEFKEAILKGMDRSAIFVLFASVESLSRDWVKFEISTAEKAVAAAALSRVLTVIIDDGISVSDIPDWMKATLIVRQTSPGLIALDIRRHINSIASSKKRTYFVGRGAESDRAVEIITSFVDPAFRPPLIIYGLSGIGRRSLTQIISENSLSYAKQLIVELSAGDLLPELMLKLSNRISASALDDPQEFVEQQAKRPVIELVSDIVTDLRRICEAGTLPVILDDGAMLSSEGVISSQFDALYNAIAADQNVDAVFVSNRRMHSIHGRALPFVQVPELSHGASQSLIRLMARDRGLILSSSDLDALAVYTRGYPPAINFAMQEVDAYGLAYVIGNQASIVNFSAEIFVKKLRAADAIDATMALIMQCLSSYGILPPQVIVNYCDIGDAEKFSSAISKLIDNAFIRPYGANYRISEPIRDAAYRVFGGLKIDHAKMADIIEKFLSTTDDDDIKLPLGQSLFRAVLLSGGIASSEYAVGLASDWVQLAKRSYHDQEYDLAIKFGAEAIKARPENVDVRRYLSQALARREMWTESLGHIEELEKRGHIKDAFFARGFFHKRKREYKKAIDAYGKSVEYGRDDPAVHRELAVSYFEDGNLRKAEEHIGLAERRGESNSFVVDLKCTIALRLGDLAGAEKSLATLERIEPGGFYHHRRSTFEQASGNSSVALEQAELARDMIANPPFEVLANLANCQMEMEQLERAGATLAQIDQRFGLMQHDAKAGLRCKLEARRGNIALAESMWQRIRDKHLPTHLGLRKSLLNKKSAKEKLTDAETEELIQIEARLTMADGERLTRLLGSILAATG